MNGRQAARVAAARIEGLESDIQDLKFANNLYRVDVVAYNNVIGAMIEGKSPCPWCNDYEDCKREEKDQRGCSDWFLTVNQTVTENTENTEQEGRLALEGIQ